MGIVETKPISMIFPPPKALILDRDGTILKHIPYLHNKEQVQLLPTVRDALSYAIKHKILLFMHTNQSGVGRSLFTLEEVHACNERMIELLNLGVSPFARICIAPEAPDEPSNYRKPSPKFAEEICQDYHLLPSELCYIGDNATDLATAAAARTNAVGLTTGLHDIRKEVVALGLPPYSIFDSLLDACYHLLPSYYEL